MKTLTPPLIKFAIVATLLTILFRFSLSASLEHYSFYLIIGVAMLYFIGMFIIGKYFGIKDCDHLPIYDIGFRFHVTTFIVHNTVSYSWFFLHLNSKLENIGQLYTMTIIWGFLLLTHCFYYIKTRKHSIKHLDKDDLFE